MSVSWNCWGAFQHPGETKGKLMHTQPAKKRPHGKVHPPSRFDSGDGQGTSHGAPKGEKLLEHPILDGSSESDEVEHEVDNPWRGLADPSLTRHPGRRRRT